jgi:hypothetical protein
MASLIKKIFETMPLVGAAGAVNQKARTPAEATMGKLKRYIGVHEEPLHRKVTTQRPSKQFVDALNGIVDGSGKYRDLKGQWDLVEIWGWETRGDPSRVDDVTCRVHNDSFNDYVVLTSLEWGYAPPDDPTSFKKAVAVLLKEDPNDPQKASPVELPLTEQFRLVTFTVRGGYIPPKFNTDLWPIRSRLDRSYVHVFVYDVDRTTREIVSLKDPLHPQREEILDMLTWCDVLNDTNYDEDTRPYSEYLFQDNLWETSRVDTPPTGTVPEHVQLSVETIRILVACSFTPCRERNDYQPGGPAAVGRLFPHVMVASTAALERVDAGVRFTRPATTTLLDGAHCGCDEMLPEIHTLLTADANADNMVLKNAGTTGPHAYWANLFNYYVTDPLSDPNLKGKAIHVVKRDEPWNRQEDGWVKRDCSDIFWPDRQSENAIRVNKRGREGLFDNIHVAPHMTVKDKFDRVIIDSGTAFFGPVFKHKIVAPFTSYKEWKMDDVVMAPFCPHDCFHMHWRWTENCNDVDATYGWGPFKPNVLPGAPMVPENQDVFLVLHTEHSFSYLAQAHDVPKNIWQPFCHHGAAYAVSVAWVAEFAKFILAEFDGMRFALGSSPSGDSTVLGNWALFYWRLRYRLRPVARTDANGQTHWDVEVQERFSFKSEPRALAL